jgi:uncharacterized protein YndB with AHSA1/START domain
MTAIAEAALVSPRKGSRLKRAALAGLVLVGGAVVAVLGLAAAQPDTMTVERSAVIAAPAERIFPLLNDFQRWGAWSPWETKDPAMRRAFSGPASGVGAVYEWEGNGEVGKGRMEIIEAVPAAKLALRLDFIEPMEGHNVVEFSLMPEGGSTRVRWRMHGGSSFLCKVMTVLLPMDAMIGGEFEAGLAKLKTATEL